MASKRAKKTTRAEFGAIRYVKQPPKAGALVESLRAIGYTVGDAIADLIDNSVAARAKNIWLDFDWASGGKVRVTILDDGIGMTPEPKTVFGCQKWPSSVYAAA